ncbi:NADP-specific glutamate dehydrogenase [Parapedobacter sp. 10938]|uniref:NADP-specific glutamate dehydrogenase n=1 Tax=Parapedobacter flavus TaxID=3110225 RepID=UPI002DBDB0F4|nr:NADP-specific glutamate dehydrogenase [Parapedobacter sp. 10938]MEC3879667.1 NADP-specific glutamate dehydrogenase [Parapedobacter sp. 10938]
MSNYFESFVDYVSVRNPNQPEYLQAVREVAEDVIPYIETQASDLIACKLFERITEPERTVSFRVVWLDDSNNVQINRGYRVQMNSALGPYKGGLRFSPTVNLSVLKFLAFEQTFKNSLTGLPLGAGKGGSDFDPRDKSDNEIMRFCQSFMTELYRHIGGDTDVPAGDIGVGEREIGYLFGQYKRIQNSFTGVLTGKGPAWGGSFIRPEATGFGLLYFVERMLYEKQDTLKGKKVAISGAGNVAYYAALKAISLGAKVITISNSNGTIYDEQGFSQEKLDYVNTLKRNLKEYTNRFPAEYHSGKKPWQFVCDIALPCATQNELDEQDVKQLLKGGCICIAEGANMPCTELAVKAIMKAKILYAPGKAANAGGVAVSGLEMSQNRIGQQWNADKVDGKLKKIMQEIHDTCVHYGKDRNGVINYMKGANIGGFVKVAMAMKAQGYV